MILGLDISTKSTGVAILENDGTLTETFAIDMRNGIGYNDLYDRLQTVYNHLERIKRQYEIENIFIEEKLMKFSNGRSTAHILSVLSHFNGMVSSVCYFLFQMKPKHINVKKARSLVVGKIPQDKDEKKYILQFIAEKEGDKFQMKYTRNGFPSFEMTDKADAIVIARAGLQIMSSEYDSEEMKEIMDKTCEE